MRALSSTRLSVALCVSLCVTRAGYTERSRQGGKFDVADRPQRTQARGVAGNPDEVRVCVCVSARPCKLTPSRRTAYAVARV